MFKSLLGTVLAFVTVVSPQLLDGITTCQMTNQTDPVEGRCPVKLTPVPLEKPGRSYSECVIVHVWMKDVDLSKAPTIGIHLPRKEIETIRPNKKRKKNPVWCKTNVEQFANRNMLWELMYNCTTAEAQTRVTVSYSTRSTRCNVTYTVPDPVPNFHLSVDPLSKSITVTVEPGDRVHTRWCYRQSAVICSEGLQSRSELITIDPATSKSAPLIIPFLLPCVCVQVYYTRTDSRRHMKCPFYNNNSLTDVRDVWLSSEVTLFESHLTLSSECPARDMKISAALCWRQHEHLCTPALNSTLQEQEEDGSDLIFNTSAVDKHPQMCVQFSLQGSWNISCPFQADMSTWEVYIEPGKQSVFVYVTSSDPATFSAQLCVLNERGCLSTGPVYSAGAEGNNTERRIHVPLYFIAERPCVQVWQSDPALHGRRILCPDYTHNRFGMYAVAALVLVVVVVLLGVFLHSVTKEGAADWLYIQKPLLLVCSSDQASHVSAVCTLASILQGDLSATVHVALCAHSSQGQAAVGTSVADLGPIPWLYGQWESMRKAQGKVLIIWSPEAKQTYEKWREDKYERQKEGKAKVTPEQIREEVEENSTLNGSGVGGDKLAGQKDCIKVCDDKDWCTQNNPSTVIEPVFKAALACLEGALQECKDLGVALVYFQGLCHSRDIPKNFRGVPRYCIPHDFSGLIQELGGMTRRTKPGRFTWHCWPRLMSKVLSIWLARQLAHRLQTLLPQTQGKKMQGQRATSSPKMASSKTRHRLKFPMVAKTADPGNVQEQEALNWSPGRAERL